MKVVTQNCFGQWPVIYRWQTETVIGYDRQNAPLVQHQLVIYGTSKMVHTTEGEIQRRCTENDTLLGIAIDFSISP